MEPVPVDQSVQVELIYCAGPHQTQQISLRLAAGSTLADAISAGQALGVSDWDAAARRPVPASLAGPAPTTLPAPNAAGVEPEPLRWGVWSKVREPGYRLREGDRIELYRSLLVDPKEARRLRYAQHKAKLASLGPPRLIHKKTG
jgi:uncharacterized protein